MKVNRKWIVLNYTDPDSLRAEDIPYDALNSIKDVIDSIATGSQGTTGIQGETGIAGIQGATGIGIPGTVRSTRV